MKNSIIEIMTSVIKIEEDALLAAFDDSSVWDSLQRVEVLLAIEEEFDVQFEEEELTLLVTPQQLCEAAMRKAEE